MNPNRLIVLVALWACGSDGNGFATASVRDSAGIRIVENPAQTPIFEWHVDDQPLADIGGIEADAYHSVFRVSSIARLSDETIVIANSGTSEVRYFDREGSFLHAVGGEGQGPGEFQGLIWLASFADDSIITYDIRQLRFSVFTRHGTFVRSFRFLTNDAVAFARVIGMYDDGSFLALGFADTRGERPSGLQRYGAPLYHISNEGHLLSDLGVFPGNEAYYKAFDGGFGLYELFFPKMTYRFVRGNDLMVASNDAYEIKRYTQDGTLTEVIRRNADPVRVSDSHLRIARERMLEDASEERRQVLESTLLEMPVSEVFPAYSLVRGDDLGNVWVQEYPIPGEESDRWDVFNPDGELLGSVALPSGLDPKHIGSDFVAGVWRDDLDIEHVQLYGLVKGR